MTEKEIVMKLRTCIAMREPVFLGNIEYLPHCLIYGYDYLHDEWSYSVELIDAKCKRSTVRTSVKDVKFINEECEK